ncbi:uncharacterized protein [Apostichopus japonicus]|uniref:uncharacterized protein n=1 Tax=Stichopus japonicus TaxID=307972 RepID=UPI003AB7381D
METLRVIIFLSSFVQLACCVAAKTDSRSCLSLPTLNTQQLQALTSETAQTYYAELNQRDPPYLYENEPIGNVKGTTVQPLITITPQQYEELQQVFGSGISPNMTFNNNNLVNSVCEPGDERLITYVFDNQRICFLLCQVWEPQFCRPYSPSNHCFSGSSCSCCLAQENEIVPAICFHPTGNPSPCFEILSVEVDYCTCCRIK